MELEKITPYQDGEKTKKEQVQAMFDNIAGTYDSLNHILSLGIDKLWRKKAISYLKATYPENVLDVATGTGDFALEILKQVPLKKVKAIDISGKMLEIARQKAKDGGLEEKIEFQFGDAENIGYRSNSFDGVTVAFGVRNFEDLDGGLREMHRVLNDGGSVFILELSEPENYFIRSTFKIYSRGLMPLIGKIVSKDKRAYDYLPESVEAFPQGPAFLGKLKQAGFKKCRWEKLTFGICSLYVAQK